MMDVAAIGLAVTGLTGEEGVGDAAAKTGEADVFARLLAGVGGAVAKAAAEPAGDPAAPALPATAELAKGLAAPQPTADAGTPRGPAPTPAAAMPVLAKMLAAKAKDTPGDAGAEAPDVAESPDSDAPAATEAPTVASLGLPPLVAALVAPTLDRAAVAPAAPGAAPAAGAGEVTTAIASPDASIPAPIGGAAAALPAAVGGASRDTSQPQVATPSPDATDMPATQRPQLSLVGAAPVRPAGELPARPSRPGPAAARALEEPAVARPAEHAPTAVRAPDAALARPIAEALVPAVPTTADAPALTAAPAPAALRDAAPADLALDRQLDLARDGEWLDQLARDIARSGAAEGALRFKLNPEHLGSLHVEVSAGERGTSVRLTAETEAARAIIADARPQLVAEARAQGIRIAETHVDLGGQGQPQAQGGNAGRDGRQATDSAYLTSWKPESAEEDATPDRRETSERYA
jgi:hypothetical protein